MSGEDRRAEGPAPAPSRGEGAGTSSEALDVEVERELVRMRTQPDRVNFVLPLVVDPGFDQVRSEHVALQQEIVVLLEIVENDIEGARKLLDLLGLGRRQLVEVLVHRLPRVDLVGDAVETRHDARGERQVRIAGRVRRPELNAL